MVELKVDHWVVVKVGKWAYQKAALRVGKMVDEMVALTVVRMVAM